MATSPEAPLDALDDVHRSEGRLLATVATLDDDAMGRQSLLPGWTVGHVLTHLARNADSHVRRTQAAIDGVMVDQYPGGLTMRAADIEAGAGRPAAVVGADVGASTARLLEAWSDVPAYAWAKVTRDSSGGERRLDGLPGRRWLEVEIHLVDLGCGPTFHDWSDAFVAVHLPEMRESTPTRLAPGDTLPAPGSVDIRAELAWLFGRLERADLPVLSSWQ
ncbi:MAG TPA: maleylpyruvate isomerase N-terminal domain-containing protein [Acidimicrobiales bacterium]